MSDQRRLVVSAKDPTLLKSEVAVVAEIESSLRGLKNLAAVTNFEDPAQVENFSMNIGAMTRFYESAERMALNVVNQQKS
jgi:hypothetical protein